MSSSESTDASDGAASKSGSLTKTLVEFFMVALLASAAGVGVAWVRPPPAAATAVEGAAKSGESEPPGAIRMLDLPPVVTNIGSPVDTWVRMESSIVIESKGEPHPEIMAAEIANDEMTYLRTITLTQLQGPIGLQNIRQDMADRAMIRSGGKVSEFILRALVVQ
jgi:flagellar FliL protein